MSGLVPKLNIASVWTDARAFISAQTGTPVTATPNGDGRALSDTYALTFTSVVASTSATYHLATGSSANPYNGRTGSVNLNGSTVYSDIIPGVDLVFSNSGSFSGSWAATVTIGLPLGVRNAFPPDAGTASDPIEVRVYNTGSDTGSDCKARLLAVLKAVKITGTVFEKMRSFAEAATEKITGEQIGPYAVTVSSVTGSGSSKTMTVQVDGSTRNVENQTDLSTGASTGLNVNDYYKFTSGPLTDMEFKLSQAAANGDKVNVLVFSQRFAQIAPDVSGAPGDWGTADVDLTESGEATGDITAGGFATFWLRVLVPAAAVSGSNPYIVDVCLEGSALNAAGWTA